VSDGIEEQVVGRAGSPLIRPGIAACTGQRGAQPMNARVGSIEAQVGAEQTRGIAREPIGRVVEVTEDGCVASWVRIDTPRTRQVVALVGWNERQDVPNEDVLGIHARRGAD
jgi:hypothetical protein